MSKKEMAKVVGRAVTDKEFAELLAKSPKDAAKAANARLSSEEVESLQSLNLKKLKEASIILMPSPRGFFDTQQQNQNQAGQQQSQGQEQSQGQSQTSKAASRRSR